MDILEKLKELDEPVPKPAPLPTEADIKSVEEKLNIVFPPSYRKFQLEYSNINVGTFEPYWMFQDGSYLDIVKGNDDARKHNSFLRI